MRALADGVSKVSIRTRRRSDDCGGTLLISRTVRVQSAARRFFYRRGGGHRQPSTMAYGPSSAFGPSGRRATEESRSAPVVIAPTPPPIHGRSAVELDARSLFFFFTNRRRKRWRSRGNEVDGRCRRIHHICLTRRAGDAHVDRIPSRFDAPSWSETYPPPPSQPTTDPHPSIVLLLGPACFIVLVFDIGRLYWVPTGFGIGGSVRVPVHWNRLFITEDGTLQRGV